VSALRTRILPLLVISIAINFAAPVAHAAGEERALRRMVDLNKRALAAHAAGRQQTAKKLLLDALTLAKGARLDSHLMTARTNIHLGVVSIVGLKQREEGLTYFAQGLKIRPDIKLTPRLATPALEADLALARKAKPAPPARPPAPATVQAPPPAPAASTPKPKELAAGPPPRGVEVFAKDEEPDVPATVPQPLYCPTPIEGPPGEEVNLLCLTQPEVNVSRVIAYYRSADDTYIAVRMNRSKKGWYSAVIPGNHVTGRSLQFYFEGHGEGEDVAIQNGKGESPNVIVIKDGAPPVGVGALAALHAGAALGGGNAEDSPIEAREKEDARAERQGRRRRRLPGTIWIGLGAGTAMGFHGQRPLERHPGRAVTTGASSDGLGHLAPELGWQMSEDLSLSLQSRHQYLPSSGSGDAEATGAPPKTAHAVLARLQYVLMGIGDLQLLGTAVLGGGSALRLKVEPARELGLVTSDTVVIGPLVAGVGAGAAYNISSRWLALAEARTLVAGWKPGLLIELNAGVQLGF
jgi:hypothetical protein